MDFAYAEFAAIYPESGGGYAYIENTFDTDFTYIVGWSMILGYPANATFYLASFSDWFYRFILPLFAVHVFGWKDYYRGSYLLKRHPVSAILWSSRSVRTTTQNGDSRSLDR